MSSEGDLIGTSLAASCVGDKSAGSGGSAAGERTRGGGFLRLGATGSNECVLELIGETGAIEK